MENFINKLKKYKVKIDLVDDNLKLDIPENFENNVLLEEIKSRKQELISFIKKINDTSDFRTIERCGEKESYTMSSAQKRLYFLYEFDPSSVAYNMPQLVKIRGKVDKERLANAFQQLIIRHEILRTSFSVIEGEPLQKIAGQGSLELEYYQSEEEGTQSVINEFIRPFDLNQGPLIRVGLLSFNEENHLLMVDMHHIVTDGVSQAVLVRDFKALYDGEELQELKLQYKDYAEWQQSEGRHEQLTKEKGFWLNLYEEPPHILDLPTDFSRPAISKRTGDWEGFKIDKDSTSQLKEIAEETGVTLYMILLSVYNILLAKLTNQEDIIVGTPVAGREHSDLENIVGVFLNSLPLRNKVVGTLSFKEFLRELSTNTVACFDNQSHPYEDLLDELKIERTPNRNPLYGVMFSYQKFEEETLELSGLTLEPYENDHKVSKLDLTLYAFDQGDHFSMNFEYSTELFKRETIGRFVSYFQRIVASVITAPDRKISEISILSSSEREDQLYTYNATSVAYPQGQTVLSLFAAQVSKHPDAPALSCEGEILTYQDLDGRSNHLARLLKGKGIGKGSIVALMLDRSPAMVISIWGVLKAGGAYLPLEVDHPQDRKSYLLQDSGAELLLTTGPLSSGMGEGVPVFLIDGLEACEGPSFTEEGMAGPSDLCYIIYTSGSTGKPKGVMVEHGSLYNYICWASGHYLSEGKGTFPLYSSISFDLTVTSIFTPLCTGNKLVVYRGSDQSSLIGEVFGSEEVDVIKLTPSHLKLLREGDMLPASFPKGKKLIVGGEELESSLAGDIYDRFGGNVRIYNEYGPTEATVGCMVYEYSQADGDTSVPIGGPIGNTQVYVLDNYLQPVASGVAGELYVSGSGLARGYLSNDSLTDDRFVSNPFLPGTKMYRTGDLAKRLLDGRVVFKGRVDDQVKLRGYRIELGEIEYQLSGHPSVLESVLMVRDHGNEGEKVLVGYYMSEGELDSSMLRDYLSGHLPEYMLPSYYVYMESWPLTSNGKLDKGSLPAPELIAGEVYVAPRTDLEVELVGLWSEVIGVEESALGVTSNFFVLGGDSIKSIRLVVAINKRLGVSLSLPDLFQHPSVSLLAEYIEGPVEGSGVTLDVSGAALEVGRIKERVISLMGDSNVLDVFPMSDIEKGMVYHSLSNRGGAVYHDQNVYNIGYKKFDMCVFRRAVGLLVDKHANLRTGFNLNDYDEPLSLVYRKVEGVIVCEDISSEDKAGQERIVEGFMSSDREDPFDFDGFPLWRMQVFKTGLNDICLLWIFHHSILDGWSSASLMTELNNTYLELLSDSSYRPGVLGLSYRDYVVQELAASRSEEIKSYWKKELDGVSGTEFKDLDAIREIGNNDIGSFQRGFSQDFHQQLVVQSKLYNVGVKELCFAAYLYAINMLTYDNELLIGLVTNNRPAQEEGDKILGCFLNTIPFKIDVPQLSTCRDWVSHVNDKVLETRKYQQMSLFEIMSLVNKTGGTNKSFFNSIFLYVDFHIYKDLNYENDMNEGQTESHALSVDFYEKTDTDLDVRASILNGSVHLDISYSKSKFREEYIHEFWSYFERVMHMMVQDPALSLSTADILSSEEKNQLTYGLNATEADYPKEETLISLFEKQVKVSSENIALVYDGVEVTYHDLNAKANQLAHYLRSKGVEEGSVVGLMIERSVEMIVGIIGILKAGGTYLPLDTSQPENRIGFVLEESNALLLLANKYHEEVFGKYIDTIDVNDEAIASMEKEDLGMVPSSLNVAYIIYTSGSTGKPKGVMVSHRSVVNLVCSQKDTFGTHDQDRVLQFSNVIFDASVEQTWVALLSGSALVLVDKEKILDSNNFNDYIETLGITHLDVTPSFLERLRPTFHNGLKRIVVGGEDFKVQTARRLYKDYKVYNAYGPTEATITSIEYLIEGLKEGSRIPIGKPVNNTWVYIMDKNRGLLPKGIAGELYIGGEGLSKGYVNDEALTKEKFLDDPFRPGQKVYKTGDLARWLPDGNIEFMGRIDDQVKIRGFRIELGEIEHQLAEYEEIKEAVVQVMEVEGGGKYLVAYYISKEVLNTTSIRDYLSDKLPDYMVPTYYVHLEKFPLNASGKVDKKALPALEFEVDEDYMAPSNEIEEQLVSIWSEVLKLDKKVISINKSFFEIGGHSLNAVVLVNKIHKKFNVKFSLEEIFTKPTIEMISEYIDTYQWLNEKSDIQNKKTKEIIL